MDFSLGSLVSSGNGVAYSERSLDSMVSETDDTSQQHQRKLSNSAMPQGNAEELFIPSSPLKRPRSASELHSSDPRDDLIAPLKLARNDSFFNRSHQQLKTMQSGSAGTFHAPRNASSVPESRMFCSPVAYRSISEDVLLNNESSYNSGTESSLPRIDPQLMSYSASFLAGQSTSPLRCVPSFEHDPYTQQHRLISASVPFVMRREGIVYTGVHEAVTGSRQVFTAAQWAELEHQALIYKYLMHGAPVPAELLLPLRRSLANMSGIPLPSESHRNDLRPAGWPSFQLAASCNVDPEPGRCRRTDGKKWRCARPVVPEQKYCERHVHRGRHRKKTAEAQNSTAAAPLPSPKAASSTSAGRDSCESFPFASDSSNSLQPAPTTNLSSHSRHMSNRTFSMQNLATSGGIAIGVNSSGSLTFSHQLALPLHSASGLSSGKDNRSIDGLSKANASLRPEQLPLDFSGSTGGLGDHTHLRPALPSSLQLYYHVQPQKEHGQLAYVEDTTRRNMLLGHHEHRHYNRPSLFPGEALQGDTSKPSEGQALRHFFDDWPRTRDSSTLSWSDADDEKQKVNTSAHLSISLNKDSSDVSASDSPTRGKTMISPLCLSMRRNTEDIADPTRMGLGVGMGLGINNSSRRQACWVPRSLEQGVGGPLAEVLQSGGSQPGKISSLNFLRDEWDANQHEAPCIVSPTGVLQKVTLGTCFSDSSSNASSPGSIRNEHTIADNQRLNPVLTNCSSRLST